MVDVSVVSNFEEGYLTSLQHSNLLLLFISGLLLYRERSKQSDSSKRLFLLAFVLSSVSLFLVDIAFRNQLQMWVYQFNVSNFAGKGKALLEKIASRDFRDLLGYITYIPSLQMLTLGLLFTGAVWHDYLCPFFERYIRGESRNKSRRK